MNRQRVRSRIVGLIGLAGLLGLLNVFAGASLEEALGWSAASFTLFAISAVLLLIAIWSFLGLLIDLRSSGDSPPKKEE